MFPQASLTDIVDDGMDPAAASSNPQSLPSLGNVWFDQDFNGGPRGLFPLFRDLSAAAMPAALEAVADRLGRPDYRHSMRHALRVRIVYDRAHLVGGQQMESFSRSDGRWSQTVVLNMALWDYRPAHRANVDVIRHELSHAMLHDITGDKTRIPQWFDEGLAKFSEPDGGELSLIQAYRELGADYARQRPCELQGPGQDLPGRALTMCYPSYVLALQYLDERYPGSVQGIIADLEAGLSTEDAVKKRTGQSWPDFKKNAYNYYTSTFDCLRHFVYIPYRPLFDRTMRWCRG